jgi:hypothetical protein
MVSSDLDVCHAVSVPVVLAHLRSREPVPLPDRAVVGAGVKQPVLPREAQHGRRVPPQDRDALARALIPHTHGFIARRRQQPLFAQD